MSLLRFAWRTAVTALAAVGWGLAISTLVSGWSQAGHDAYAYWRAGEAVLGGAPVYQATYGQVGAFLYAPPLAVLAIPAGRLPFELFEVALLAFNVAALRYVVGSWRWAGIVLLYPWAVNELYVGNVNFPIAAALVAAFRASTAPLALAGLAKVAPFVALPQLVRQGRPLRPLLIGLGASVAITLPFLTLWPAWFAALSSTDAPISALPLPLVPRLVLAVMLLGVAWYRRADWLAALAVVAALPVLWPSTLVMLAAPMRLFAERRSTTPEPMSGVPAHPPTDRGLAPVLFAGNDPERIGPPA